MRYSLTLALIILMWLCMRGMGTSHLRSEIKHTLFVNYYTYADIVGPTYLGCGPWTAYGVYFNGIEQKEGFGVARVGYVCCGFSTCEISAE